MSARHNGQLVVCSKTPLSTSAGRSRIDADVNATNTVPSGRGKTVTPSDAQPHPTGRKHVDPQECHAAGLHNGSAVDRNAGVIPVKGRRHNTNVSNIAFGQSGSDNLPKPQRRPYPQGNRCSAKVAAPAGEGPFGIETDVKEQKAEFKRITSPKDRSFTFEPVAIVDNRRPEGRLMRDGQMRKERGHRANPQSTLTPPWAISL